VADDITLEPVDMEGVPGEWSMAPACKADCVLIFFHGGGYCCGSIRSHRRMVTEAGRAGALRTLAVRYRLAPEHPFPAALEDALTAWHFVRGQGFSALSVAVGGDSAGGGLTIASLNTLKECGEELPACSRIAGRCALPSRPNRAHPGWTAPCAEVRNACAVSFLA